MESFWVLGNILRLNSDVILGKVRDLLNSAWERQLKILFRQGEVSLMTGNPVLIATRPACPSRLLHVNAAFIVRLHAYLQAPPLPLKIRLSSADTKDINWFKLPQIEQPAPERPDGGHRAAVYRLIQAQTHYAEKNLLVTVTLPWLTMRVKSLFSAFSILWKVL